MRALLLAAALAGGCDTWAAHPVSMSVVVGGAAIGGGALLIDDGHPVAGGAICGAAAGAALVAIVLGVIIDNFNEAHSGTH